MIHSQRSVLVCSRIVHKYIKIMKVSRNQFPVRPEQLSHKFKSIWAGLCEDVFVPYENFAIDAIRALNLKEFLFVATLESVIQDRLFAISIS